MPFCQREAADDAEQERLRARRRGRSAPAAPPCSPRAAAGASRRRWRPGAGSVAGSHTASSMPFRMPVSTSARCAQQPVESHAALRRADLRRVGRRHGGDPVRERQPGLEVADRRRSTRRRRSPRRAAAGRSRPAARGGNCPWKARLCTVITVPGTRRAAVVQQRRGEAGLPVVGVDDIRRDRRHGPRPIEAAHWPRAAKRSALSGHGRPSGPVYGLPARA